MRLNINPVLDMQTLQWLPSRSYEYNGSVMLFEGSSPQAQSNEAAQTGFYNTMMGEQQLTFGQNQALLDMLKNTWSPILNAGPGQQGFTPQENAALRTDITNTGAIANTNAINADLLRTQQQTGGANVLPSGASNVLADDATILSGQNTANALTSETAANYAQGLANFNNASTVLSGTAGLENPVGFGGAANQAGGNATSAINLVDSQNTSLLNTVLGGLAAGTGKALGTLAK